MTTKVIINGLVVEGSFEDIQRILGIQSVSANSDVVAMQRTNTVNTFFDNANLVQRQEQVVELGKSTSKDVETKYSVEKCGNSFRIKHNIITRGKKYIDKVTGQEKQYRFNKVAVNLANNAIKALNEHPDFKGQLLEFKIPFDNGSGKSFKGWGFKTKKMAEAALDILPKVIKAEDIDKVKNAN